VLEKIWTTKENMQYKIWVLLWRWRSGRNKANAGGRMASIAEVCSSTEYYLMFFDRLNESNKKDKKGGKQSWVAPPLDYYKTHCDAPYALISRKEDGVSLPVTAEESY
jgi:hypothetical protein